MELTYAQLADKLKSKSEPKICIKPTTIKELDKLLQLLEDNKVKWNSGDKPTFYKLHKDNPIIIDIHDNKRISRNSAPSKNQLDEAYSLKPLTVEWRL